MKNLYCWKLNDLLCRHIKRMTRRGQRVRGSHIAALSVLTLREMHFAIRETIDGSLAHA
jgi:hypothetical protein